MSSASQGDGDVSFPWVWVDFGLVVPAPDCISACRSVP